MKNQSAIQSVVVLASGLNVSSRSLVDSRSLVSDLPWFFQFIFHNRAVSLIVFYYFATLASRHGVIRYCFSRDFYLGSCIGHYKADSKYFSVGHDREKAGFLG